MDDPNLLRALPPQPPPRLVPSPNPFSVLVVSQQVQMEDFNTQSQLATGDGGSGSSSSQNRLNLMIQAPPVPQLAINLQAMSIAATEEQRNFHPEEQFGLYMKIASADNQGRVPAFSVVQQSMRRAWRANYCDIIQVHRYVFKAVFSSYRAMMWVFKRQPWLVQSEVMLLEIVDKKDEGFEKEQKRSMEIYGRPRYEFKHIYVTVRGYGIPWRGRSLDALHDLLKIAGMLSDLHEPNDNMLHSHPDYIWGVVKHTVSNPVVDKVKLYSDQPTGGLAYLQYEKIGRICLFCGIMFHNAGNCFLRQSIITDRLASGLSTEEVPFYRYGQWVVNTDKLPKEIAQLPSTNSAHESSPLLRLPDCNEQQFKGLTEAASVARIQAMELTRSSLALQAAPGAPLAKRREQHEGFVHQLPGFPRGPLPSVAESQEKVPLGRHVQEESVLPPSTAIHEHCAMDESLVQLVNHSDAQDDLRNLDFLPSELTGPSSSTPVGAGHNSPPPATEHLVVVELENKSGFPPAQITPVCSQKTPVCLQGSTPLSAKRPAPSVPLPPNKRAALPFPFPQRDAEGPADTLPGFGDPDRRAVQELGSSLSSGGVATGPQPFGGAPALGGAGILGASPFPPPPASPGPSLRPLQLPPPSAAQLRAAAASAGSRPRRSRWEPPTLPSTGGNIRSPLGTAWHAVHVRWETPRGRYDAV